MSYENKDEKCLILVSVPWKDRSTIISLSILIIFALLIISIPYFSGPIVINGKNLISALDVIQSYEKFFLILSLFFLIYLIKLINKTQIIINKTHILVYSKPIQYKLTKTISRHDVNKFILNESIENSEHTKTYFINLLKINGKSELITLTKNKKFASDAINKLNEFLKNQT